MRGVAILGRIAASLLVVPFGSTIYVISALKTLFSWVFSSGTVNVKKAAWASPGRYAIITGGSTGIGNAYAQVLAENGMNVIITSRCMRRAQEVSKMLLHKYMACECYMRCVYLIFFFSSFLYMSKSIYDFVSRTNT